MKLIVNFKHDFEEYMRQTLISNNFKNIPDGREKLYVHYINAMNRRIVSHKRKILKSGVFNCPKNFRTGLQYLEDAVIKGKNLLPWQSKNILNSGYNDEMCNDWGIYHLHLGETKEDESDFIKRTRLVLYCLIDLHAVYFIQILEHGKIHINEIVEIAEKNWPDVLYQNKNRNPGVSNITAKIENLQASLLKYENYVKENFEQFARQIKRIIHIEAAELEFHLFIDPQSNIAYAEELNSKIHFKLGLL
ncbi:MAG: hypothetical protein OEV78_07815 [Spirochaetia bacterium]|nr:hypothetical protein [Spirochaetia bacterium]